MKKGLIGWLSVASLALSGCFSGRSTESIPAVTDFNLDRYYGQWYEIARLPHSFEEGMDEVSANYTPDPDGFVRVVNRGVRNGEEHTISGRAYLKGAPTVGELRVSFFRPFYGDYRIIELAEDYSYAVVTSSRDNYFWLLSRTPRLPESQVQEIMGRAAAQGFAVDKMIYPKQKSDSGN